MSLPAKRAPAFAPRPDTVIGYCDGKPVQIDQNLARYLDEILIDRINLANAPLATVFPYAGSTEPTGWLICNGQSVSTRTYADLFALIGYTYGGSGSSFSVPDYTNRLLMGSGTLVTLGGTAGASEVTLAQANLPAYDLTVTDPGHTHTVTDPGHTHGVTDPGHTHSTGQPAGAADSATGAVTTSAVAGTTGSATTGVTVDSATTGVTNEDATTDITVNSAGGGEAVSIIPPVVGVNYIIKA